MLEHVAHLGGLVAFVDRRALGLLLGDDGSFDQGHHPRRREPDAEQAPLAFRDDLEADRRLVDPGAKLLELTQRGPFRLADRLARGFDLQGLRLGHLRAPRFLRLTLRGCEG